MDYSGIIISKDGLIFTADNYVLPEVIDRITVTGPDGKIIEARPNRLLTKTCGQILKLSEPLPQGWKSLQFSEAPKKLDNKTKFYGVEMIFAGGSIDSWQEITTMTRTDEKQYFHIQAAEPYSSSANKSYVPDNFSFGSSNAMIICDANANVLGVSSYGRIDTDTEAPIWKGADVLADSGINREESENRIKKNLPRIYTRLNSRSDCPQRRKMNIRWAHPGFLFGHHIREAKGKMRYIFTDSQFHQRG